MGLETFGWSSFFSEAFAPYEGRGLDPARVVLQQRNQLTVHSSRGDHQALLSGSFQHRATTRADLPVVGDWVVLDANDRIVDRLPRRSEILRKVAGTKTEAQAVAANVDVVFIVMGLDADFNPRRLERTLYMVWDSGARPIVVLNKSDLCDSLEAHREEVDRVAIGAEILVTSLTSGATESISRIRAKIPVGITAALIGSSGVGKSTLINCLLEAEELRTAEVRARDGRGRHTTTHRELFRVPGAGLVIDNPGIREIQLWGSEASLSRTFDDIAELARQCQFLDCSHEREPGCAVDKALRDGALSAARWESYLKLQRELNHLRRRQDEGFAREERQRWKQIHKDMRQRGHRRT